LSYLLEVFYLLTTHAKEKYSLICPGIENVESEKKDHDRLEYVFKYIFEEFKDKIECKKAASIACLNIAAFCRYFKRRTGKTFTQFVNDVRITHSMQLLEETNISITKIAFESGYNNLSYFNREFRNVTGTSPLKYRKSHCMN
jgi:AraC-like DNA-binding protein